MKIDIVFDSNTSSAPAGFMPAVQRVVGVFEQIIADPITLTLAFEWGALEGQPLGAAELGLSTSTGYLVDYMDAAALLASAIASADDELALAGLPDGDPTGGAWIYVSASQAKAFGFDVSPGPVDGRVALSAAHPFSFDPADRAGAGVYDGLGTLAHEITHALGRIAMRGDLVQAGRPTFSLLDLFRYSAPSVLTPSSAEGRFSVDGKTLLLPFNDPVNGGDPADWATTETRDAFDAFAGGGEQGDLSAVDFRVLDVLGFTLAKPAPTVIWRNDTGELIQWTSTPGAADFAVRQLGRTGNDWRIELTEDFNGDGRTDILWRHAGGLLVVWTSDILSDSFSSRQLGLVGLDWSIEAAADVNGDAKADLIWRNDSGVRNVWLSDPAKPAFAGQNLDMIATDWSLQAATDLDGDHRADLVWRSAQGLVVLDMENAGAFVRRDVGIVSNDWSVQAAADFDGDGMGDLLWRNLNGGLALWISTGAGFTGRDLGRVGDDWRIQQTADFNGDQAADILWRNDNGMVAMWSSTAGAPTFASQDIALVGLDWSIWGV